MLFGGYCHLRQKCVHLAKVQVTGVSRSLVCGIHNLALSFEAEVSLLQEFPRRERLLVPAPALQRTQHRLRLFAEYFAEAQTPARRPGRLLLFGGDRRFLAAELGWFSA
jgi:hypothetical protein